MKRAAFFAPGPPGASAPQQYRRAASKRAALFALGVATASAVLAAVASCGDDEPPVAPPLPPNQAPVAVGAIPTQELPATDTLTIDVSAYFSDPDNDRLVYSATTSNVAVATASVAGALVSVVAVSKGEATVTVTASDPGGLTAAQPMDLAVVAKPGLLRVVLQGSASDVGAVVLRIEGPSVDSVQAGPGAVAHHVPVDGDVHAFVASSAPGAVLAAGSAVLQFWSEDVSEVQGYAAFVEQAAATSYEQLPAGSVVGEVLR